MRDWWYGDKRDLVKWGTAIALARKQSIGSVFHVALYRPDLPNYELSINELKEPLPVEVVRHFRDIDKIQRLAEEAKIEIAIHKDSFQCTPEFRTRHDFRADYFDKVAIRIKEYTAPVIVFLDPDTGIAPETYGYEHVTHREVRITLRAMKAGDLLLFYQHARLGDGDWLNSTREEFSQAVGQTVPVKIVTCNQIAKDVAFFVVDRKDWVDPGIET